MELNGAATDKLLQTSVSPEWAGKKYRRSRPGDPLSPLLDPSRSWENNPLPRSNRFRGLGLSLIFLMDALALLTLGSAGFSKDWKLHMIGTGPGRPLGCAGVDLVILSGLRCFTGWLSVLQLTRGEWDAPRWRGALNWSMKVLCGLSLAWALSIKILVRIIAESDRKGEGLPLGWFWSGVVATAVLSAVEWRCHNKLRASVAGERSSEGEGDEENGELEPDAAHKASWSDLVRLLLPVRWGITGGFVFLLLGSTGQILIPHYTGQMIDAISDNDPDGQHRALMNLIRAALFAGIFVGLRGGTFTVLGGYINVDLRQHLFESLLRQEVGFFDQQRTGDIMSRLSADTTKVGEQVTLNVNVMLRNSAEIVGTLIFLFYLNLRLATVACISVPSLVAITRIYGNWVQTMSKATQQKLADASIVAEEAINSISTVRAFAAEHKEGQIFLTHLEQFRHINTKMGIAYGCFACINVLLPQLAAGLVLYYGSKLASEGEMSGGQIVTFMLYLASLNTSFVSLGRLYTSFAAAMGAGDKVFELMRRKPHIIPARNPIRKQHCRGELQLESIHFSYPSRPGRKILNGLSFSAQPGQVVALVGASGGGKSSCFSLLQRLYIQSSGYATLDDEPLSSYDAHWFHRKVAVVGQEPKLFSRTIRQNIIYGMEGDPDEPTDLEVQEAAKLANAHDFIMEFPDRYETIVGGGATISGGQKQRIAIARALVRKPRVLLLDEATSALDSESEAQVQEAIDHLMERGNITVLIIAHRLSTVKHADAILVVKGGLVVERGRHDELLAQDGAYAALVAKQMVSSNGTPPVLGGSPADTAKRQDRPAGIRSVETFPVQDGS